VDGQRNLGPLNELFVAELLIVLDSFNWLVLPALNELSMEEDFKFESGLISPGVKLFDDDVEEEVMIKEEIEL